MANTTYKVVWGDTLSAIALRYNTTVAELVRLNNIKNPDYIVVGQVLIVKGDPAKVKKTTGSKVRIDTFGLRSNTDRTIYASWTFSKDNVDKYQVIWEYYTKNKKWFKGNGDTGENTTSTQSLYTAPDDALQVKVKVKPISKTYKNKKGKEVSYWTGSWCSYKTYNFDQNPPKTPPVPNVTVDKYTLTASLDNLNISNSDNGIYASRIQFEVVEDDTKIFSTSPNVLIQTQHAAYSVNVNPGHKYKVRARSWRDGKYSTDGDNKGWSNYSNNVETMPDASGGITKIEARSSTSIYVEWEKVDSAKSYDLEYAVKQEYLDGSDSSSTQTGITDTHYLKTGLESGREYFFRVRAVNDKGASAWSSIKSVIIGTKPSAPTTWSSTTTVHVGEPLVLYWVHNSEDKSTVTYSELEVYIDGVKNTYTIKNTDPITDDNKNKTNSYPIDTSIYAEGTKLEWRVRTAGITKEYGDWSIQRKVDIYAPATLALTVSYEGYADATLLSLPINITATGGPSTQTPIGYSLSVKANESYETLDFDGTRKVISKGESIYSSYFDTSGTLYKSLSANDLDLENNIEYELSCIVTMNSGLTAESSIFFTVAWSDEIYEPNAEIGINDDQISVFIRPYCVDEDENLIPNVLVSVYRREFDGSFTEIIKDIDNLIGVTVTDPHPALDYARYRIIAKSKSTGAISYYDMPGYPIGETSIIIQWDEEWTDYNTMNEVEEPDENEYIKPSWSGSMIKLPYNIDVSESNSKDVSLINYTGRKNPVSYYGTQLGVKSTWNTEIDKTDSETLYALRRLAVYTGNAYVREPSGIGYWASVSVSMSQKHLDTTIPVTIDITRVEGGA